MNTEHNNDTQQPSPVGDGPSLDDLRAENARLKDTLRMRDAHDDLVHKLKKAGARTPKLLFEAAKHALKFTAEGLLENASETIEDLRGRFPEQFRSDIYEHGSSGIGAGSGQAARPALTREALARMSTAEIAKLDWSEVQRVLKAK